MKFSVKFSVITPTVLRPTLHRTCQSVDSQSHKDWQHLVMVDTPQEEVDFDWQDELVQLSGSRREVRYCDSRHNNFGNTCRGNAWDNATGDYLVYLDDDDLFQPEALEDLAAAISAHGERLVWGTFPILLLGNSYHKLPAQTGNTFGAQIVHRRIYDGLALRYPAPPERPYGADGLFADMLAAVSPHVSLCSRPLTVVDRVGCGHPRFIRFHPVP